MRTEIGSEFWDINITEENRLFTEDVQWFISGRSALQAIIEENNFKSVGLPEWCCDSVIKPFRNKNIDITFFESQDIPDVDAILVMDYFGFRNTGCIIDKRFFKGIVIRDVTHSLFSGQNPFEYHDADYYFGSLRKWAGFWTGGFAKGLKCQIERKGNCIEYVLLRKQAMQQKEAYMSEKTKSKCFLDVFKRAEQLLDATGVCGADSRDIKMARQISVNDIRKRRRENADVLIKEYKNNLIFKGMSNEDCPLFVPIMTDRRDELKEYLIENEIYCPVHWPITDDHIGISERAKQIYRNELSLVCDQRYSKEDMFKMIDIIKRFGEI